MNHNYVDKEHPDKDFLEFFAWCTNCEQWAWAAEDVCPANKPMSAIDIMLEDMMQVVKVTCNSPICRPCVRIKKIVEPYMEELVA
jgi:hypothetical protein